MMKNTEKSFFDKWHKNQNLAFGQTLAEESEICKWILQRNGFNSFKGLTDVLKDKKRILDAGCGNGRVTALLREHSDSIKTQVVGIDLTSSDVAHENLKDYKNVQFFAKNLRESLKDMGKFDFIYCQEVLHHTGDAQQSFNNLVDILGENGEIAIYVYKKKAPIREFTDDFVREKIASLEYEDAMKICRQITSLGRVLSELKVEVTVPEVSILEIKEGTYDIQRLFYHFFAKCFWNDELNFEENAAINYDWYHPQDCTRHTMDEVLKWFETRNLNVVHQYEDFFGITIRGKLN